MLKTFATACAAMTLAGLAAPTRAAEPVIDEWVKETPNGAKLLAAYRAAVIQVRAEK